MRVKIIETKGQSALVEYVAGDNTTQRCVIPSSLIVDNDVPLSDLNAGIEYGTRWEELVNFSIDSRSFADELRRRGVWTLDDLLGDVNHARGAANYLAAQIFKQYVNAARQARDRQ